ncbi:hypothetical protein ACAW74_16660 [Fibrella sp. WM1]|uniref:hypothetical protein n=1 Tax=Fibrella musci TaxID=3242485 RepID=UPI00351FCA25
MIKALSSVNLFYETIAQILGHNENDLSVVAIDSGSDKSFDFLGAAKVVTSLKELIIGLWDRVIFYREKKLHERIDLITKALPVIENINTLEKEEKIGREQAEILRRNIFTGANDFILAGAILPEFEQHSTYSPRKLMAPEPKLLNSPDIDTSEGESSKNHTSTAEGVDYSEDELTPEEEQLLKSILSKKRRRRPDK